MSTSSRPTNFRGVYRDDADARAVYSEAAGIAQIIPRAVAIGCSKGTVDQSDLAARGAHAIYLTEDGIEITDAATTIGKRPWALPSLAVDDVGTDQ